jgi:uncharacterized membrane protein
MSHNRSVDELTRKNVETIANMERAALIQRTVGERVADRFAAVVGSWPFIIIQSVILAIWVVVNITAWVRHWDPYPFILLNLALSFQAAYASPIIMMSQNRQGRLAERRNQLDLQINLLAEQENTEMLRLLRRLCEKNGIEVDDRRAIEALAQQTKPDKVVKQIEESIDATGHPDAQKALNAHTKMCELSDSHPGHDDSSAGNSANNRSKSGGI